MVTLVKQTGHTRLYRRGAYYYHRAIVPTDIKKAYRLAYGKVEETFSLKTVDRAEALRLVKIAAVQVDQRFAEVRHRVRQAAEPPVDALTKEQVERLRDSYFALLLGEDEMIRDVGFDELDDAGNIVGELPEAPQESFEEREEKVAQLESHARHCLARGKYGIEVRGEAELALEELGLKLTKKSPAWRDACKAVLKGQLEAAQAMQRRNLGDIVETPEVETQAMATMATLSTTYQDWRKEQELARVTSKTLADHDNWKDLFIECCGDLPTSQYSKEHGRNFKSTLMGLPVNRAKIKGIAGLPLPAMIEEARKRNLKTLGVTSVNKGLSRMATFFGWAVKHDYIGVNPVKDIKLKNPVQARDQRHPFDASDLRKIFAAPVYTGCDSEKHWSSPGPVILKDSPKYWVPLLGLYTGARLNEICQLRVADVRESDGISFLRIDDEGEGQRLKNQGSRRDIPLHPDLIKFGFLEYIQRITGQGHSQLFPALKRDSNGYYSDGFNKHFGRFLKSIGAKTEKKSFHSFRHSFEDACRNNGIDSGIMDALQGHSQQGMAGRYGSGYSLEVKARAIERVRYEGMQSLPIIMGFNDA